LADGHAGNARQANGENIDRKMEGIKINNFSPSGFVVMVPLLNLFGSHFVLM
jgi:hypothetical protein